MFISPAHFRFAVLAMACLVAGGCSRFRLGTGPEAPRAPTASKAASAHAPAALVSAREASAEPAPQPDWAPAAPRHLDQSAMVGQTWTFPSADPQRYGDIRFVFKKGSVEASDSGERLTGTWTVERDKLCVVLKPGATGTACYYVTGTSPGELRIRALPGGERLPLKIQ